MNKIETDEMNHKQFYVTEDEGKNPSRLSLYVNAKNQLFIEICDSSEPEDMYRYQFIVMDIDDACALSKELIENIQEMQVNARELLQNSAEPLKETHKTQKQNLGTAGREAEPPEGNVIPQWRASEKKEQLKLYSA